MSKPIRVLIVEDAENDALLLVRELRRGGFEPKFERVETAEAMARALAEQTWDLVVSDYSMPHFNGIAALSVLNQCGLDLPFIIVSGTIGEDVAVAAMKAGAHDYLMKGNLRRLNSAVERELREVDVRSQRRQAESEVKRNLERIKVLHEIDLAIMSTLDLQELLNVFLEKIDPTLPNLATTIRLFSKETGELEPVACRNVNESEWKGMKRNGLQGLAKIVLDNRLPVTVSDIQTDPRSTASDFARKERLVSYVGIPLIAKDEVLGLIAFYTKERRSFTDDEIEFLTTLAGQAAIGIYHSKLYEQVRQRSNELSALYSIAGIASKFLDINTVLLETMRKISGIFGFDAGRIYVLDSLSGVLRLVTHEGFPTDIIPPSHYQIGEGLLGKAFEREEALVFEDMQTDAEFQRLSNRKVMLSSGFRGSFFVPIRVRGANLGVMNFLSKEPRHFSPNDIQLINTIGYHLGIGVGNANLFFEVKQKSLELERSNKVKDQFLSVISHELRTPLNVSMGYTTLVKDRLLGEITSQQEAALETALKHSHELLNMINGVLSVQALEADAVENQLEEIKLDKLLDELKAYYTMLSDQNISFYWDYPRDLPGIKSDPEKLKQVLKNLIDNAIKFTEKGYVTLVARYLSQANAVEFKVSDTGIGIPKEKLPDIFEMFRQLDSSETRKFGGMGVGLFVVKKFTKMLGGVVAVESELNKGSTFTVTVPVEIASSKYSALTSGFGTLDNRESIGPEAGQGRTEGREMKRRLEQ
jgi:GAF domain-containing protein